MFVFELKSFGIDNIEKSKRAILEPKEGHVLLKLKAASLNYRDLLMVKGLYNPKEHLPLVPLSDGVGEVVSLGKNSSRFAIGDRVCPIFSQSWIKGPPSKHTLKTTLGGPIDGMLAQYVEIGEEGLVSVPSYLSDTEAATLPCAGVTAFNALFFKSKIKKGESILLLGTGGVSLFALQFGLAQGAKVIITSSSDKKLAKAHELGAFAGINYKSCSNWSKAARELCGGVGVDHVVDVGGAATFDQSMLAACIGGQINLVGNLGGGKGEINLIPLFMKGLCVHGILVGGRDVFEEMLKFMSLHKIHPVVDKVFDFEDAISAFRYLEAAKHMGKICIRF